MNKDPRDELMKMLVPKFDLQRQTKRTISNHFQRDTYDWIRLYEATEENEYMGLSYTAKRHQMIHFGIECILKSIHILTSNSHDSAENAYGNMRKCGHKLMNLYSGCKANMNLKRGFIKVNEVDILRKMDNVGVHVRYDLDLKTHYKKQSIQETYGNTGIVSGVTLSDEFHLSSYKLLLKIYNYRNSTVSNTYLSKHSSVIISDLGKIEKEIRKITKI